MRSRLAATALVCCSCFSPSAGAEEPVTLPTLEVEAGEAVLSSSSPAPPASVSRVGSEAIADAQYQVNLSESLGRVPGLVVNNRYNYAQDLQVSIRGFGARTPFGVRGVRLYSDGIPASMPDGQGQVSHFDLASADAITVLRGPFSALHGASSGGVIEVTSREPARSSLTATGWSAADALQRYALVGELASDGWSGQGSTTWFDTGGDREHSAATRLGGQLRAAGGSSRNLVLSGNVLELDAQDPLGLTRAQFDADPRQAGTNALAYDTRKAVSQSQAGVSWTPALDDAHAIRAVAWAGQRRTRQFQSIPDTVQGTAASNPTHPGGVIDLDRLYYGIDLRWIGQPFGESGLRVTAGVDFEGLDETRQGFQNYDGTPGPTSTKGVLGPRRRDEDNGATTLDPYAQLDWPFAAHWAAVAGVRHSAARFESEDHFIIAGNGDDSGTVSFSTWLPAAGIRYAAGPWAWHVAASRGAEVPTLNELAYRPDGSSGLNARLDASRSRNGEASLRWQQAPVALELVAFRTETTDEIVVASSSGGRTTFQNASGTRRQGLEASVEAQFGAGVSALAAYTLLDARYAADFAGGNRLPGVPRHNVFSEIAWRKGWARLALEGLWDPLESTCRHASLSIL